ncbi:hypothetical protein [Nonomuraea phyllanthi]|nr:hypothetical protein [Nonomuraea phyllanthi]
MFEVRHLRGVGPVIVHMEKVTRDVCHAAAMVDGGRSPEERQPLISPVV